MSSRWHILGIVVIALIAWPGDLAAEGRAKCTCIDGNGSYLYLRCPKSAPADPDPCRAVHEGMHPSKPLPKEWNNACTALPRMACFLRRHAASWRITCSLCLAKKCCPFPNWGNCPECHGEKREPNFAEQAALLAATQRMKRIGGKKIEVAISPHYAVVSDLHNLKMTTVRGAPRLLGRHEFLHLYLQRAEMARRDWSDVFGPPREMRSAMILVRSEGTRQKFSAAELGNSKTNLLYGGGSGKLVNGLAGNGFILSGRDDDDLHFNCRHMIGHLCVSSWATDGIHAKYLPQWIFRGAAHWLCKSHPRARDHAYFCSYEGVKVSGSGSRWEAKARKIASRGPSRDPVERMFQAATAKQMTFDMHVRAWSWFEIFTAEDREPFVAFLKRLRAAEEARIACKDTFGQAPEYVDDRWRERVLGKRKDVEASKKEKEAEVDLDAARSRELREIANEHDLQLMASKIRGLERCKNVRTAKLLLSLLDGKDSDRVREVITIILGRTDDEEVLAYLRGDGYARAGRIGQATLCTVFGRIGHREALPVLRDALGDGFWLVRANALRALAQLGDQESIPAIAELTMKGAGKVRIAAMDALAAFGRTAKKTIPQWERNLMHRDWQVKIATCDAFKAIGDTAAVDSLIGRLDMEGGRVHDAIKEALKALTGVDQDWRAETWRAWWKKNRKFAEQERKRAEERGEDPRPPPKPKKTDRYATGKKPPTYYGLKVYARAVGYVLDTSLSMEQGFRVSPKWEERLGHKFKATTRMGVCKEELARSIEGLDPRTRINLVFFSTGARRWKPVPVPAGSMGGNAISALKSQRPNGQTNYYDALRLILGLDDTSNPWPVQFADTPDTLFFLTDGTPTDGEITKADELLQWFGERNRFARLRVHVIAMGNTGVDREFLSKLATMNKGIFVHMTDAR